MLEIATGKIHFPSRKGFGPQVSKAAESFQYSIQGFSVGLTGFEVQFDGGDDHHIGRVEANVQGQMVDPTTIGITASLGLRDWSGDWDDSYSGSISYAIVAVVEKPAPPQTETLSGFIHSIKTTSVDPGVSPAERGLVVQLYEPLDGGLIDLAFDLSKAQPGDLVLSALLRDALALSLPVSCEVARPFGKEHYNLVNLEIKTRKIHHQAGYRVSGGQFQATQDRPMGTVRGKVTLIVVGAFGLVRGTDSDLSDVAQVFVKDREEKEVELFLGLQRADLDTSLSQLSMLLEAYRESREIVLGYYLEPLALGDAPEVKWIQYVQFGEPLGIQKPLGSGLP